MNVIIHLCSIELQILLWCHKKIHKKLVRSRITRVLSAQIIPSTIPSNWCFYFISV